VPAGAGESRGAGHPAILREHMGASGRPRRATGPGDAAPSGDVAPAGEVPPVAAVPSADTALDAEAEDAQTALGRADGDPGGVGIASGMDASGVPIHRGWAPLGGHHRWMEPFVLAILAGGGAHGYAIIGDLAQLGITNGPVDVGQVYRTLRDLEEVGQVISSWSTAGSGPARRDYELTPAGYAALDEWAALMKERARLIAEFDARYLEWVAVPRR
jgi:PadR family transcriptional regulator PadR